MTGLPRSAGMEELLQRLARAEIDFHSRRLVATPSWPWAIIWPREGGGGGVGAAASSRWQMFASQSKMAARAPGRALMCRLGRLCCLCLYLISQISRARDDNQP